MKKNAVITVLLNLVFLAANAQVGEILKKKAEEGVKRGAQVGTERTIDKVVDKSLSKIFSKKEKSPKGATGRDSTVNNLQGINQHEPALKTYSKFDFIPGEKILGYEDFTEESVGDFPAKWATNASGEIVTADIYPGKWLNVSKQGYYIPQFVKSLPENFTVEYDLLFIPSPKPSGPNTASLGFEIVYSTSSRPNFEFGPARGFFQLDPYMGNVNIASYDTKGGKILSNEFAVNGVQRQKPFKFHVSVWRQKSRLRVYLDETKIVDAPSLLEAEVVYNSLRLATSLNNDGSTWLLGNLKYATGKPDTRNKLITEGRFSTSAILFDVNTSTIKATSYAVLKEIASVLKENASIAISIIGHTDSDGDSTANIELSRKRAAAVKQALVSEFGIEEKRMSIDGKGAAVPVSSNSSAEGKAQNRRVEFIKL